VRQRISDALLALYQRVLRSGLLDRPVPRRAFESIYLAYKRLIEAGPVSGLRMLVTDGSTVIDVGANIGFFAVPFARWTGPRGRVVAIEPEAHNVASLRRRVERSGVSDIVECVQAAAADQPGQLRLAITPGHPGGHHLAEQGESVRAVTLDELVADDSRPVRLIKIDVQGAEAMVLAGAGKVIDRHHPAIYAEVDGPALERMGSSPRELIERIMSLGYAPHRLTRGGVGSRESLEALVGRSSAGYIDVLFMPD
jgi:FkbM family methyltransferase